MPTLKLQPLKPIKLTSSAAYAKAIEVSVQKTAGLVLRDLESTTKTWRTKVAFDVTITRNRGNYEVTAGTDNKVYKFVEGGTKPHVIRPKRSKYLRFRSGYAAKTRVNIIGSQPGGAFGDNVFTSKPVQHPGTKARGFLKAITSRRQKTLEQEASQAIAIIERKAE